MKIIFLLFVALNVADILTTRRALSLGGIEANKFMRWCISRLGYAWGLILPKLIVLPLIYITLLPFPLQAPYILATLCAGYACIIINNMQQIRRLRK